MAKDAAKIENVCAIARGLSKVGDRWSMLVLRDISLGLSRFDQLQENLGIAPSILTQRLRALTEAGVIAKRRYSEKPPRDEYILTEAGRDFLPVLYVLAAWGRRHSGGNKVTSLVDPNTGESIEPAVVDARTGESLTHRALRFRLPDDIF